MPNRRSSLLSASFLTFVLGLAVPLTAVAEGRPAVTKPKLSLRAPASVTAEAGGWKRVSVTVANGGRAAAKNVKLEATGQGIVAKPARRSLGRVSAGGSRSTTLRVRLTGAAAGRLALVASGGGAKARRTVAILFVPPAEPSFAGEYKSADNSVRFVITPDRYVEGFQISLLTSCGGFPSLPTYQTLTYDFPRTLLPATGPLEATNKGDDFTTTLRMTLTGTTVEAGYFSYSGPAQCSGSSEWTASRVPG